VFSSYKTPAITRNLSIRIKKQTVEAMVWVVQVELAGQRQADSFLLTPGCPENQRGYTVGRPPAKVDAKPDIVIPAKSVSKIHAVMHVLSDIDDGTAPSRLIITDRSRFGTQVNGRKMMEGETQELRAGDVVQLAPKTFLIVEELPMVVAVHPKHLQLNEVRDIITRVGARLTHVYKSGSSTHVLYDPGDVAWSALVHGALHGVPFVGLDWLRGIASAGLLVNSLPSPPHVGELLLGPVQLRVRMPLPPRPDDRRPCGLLDDLTFGYSDKWQDAGLASLIAELGGRVVSSVQEAAPGMRVVALHEGQDDVCGSGDDPWGSIGVDYLLRSILTMDMAPVRHMVSFARQGMGREAPLREAASPNPADSDMTQAAEDEDVEMEAVDGIMVAQCSGPRNEHRVSKHRGERSGLARASTGLAGGEPHDMDGWMVAARHPDGDDPQAVLATTVNYKPQQPFTAIVHEDAPPPKRRRLTASNAAKPSNYLAGMAYPTIAPGGSAEVTNQFSRPSPPTAPTPLLPFFDSIKHEPLDDGPWMSQHPHRRDSRPNGARLRVSIACTAVTVKEEPTGLPPSGGTSDLGYATTTKKAKASKAAAAEELDQLGLRGHVTEEKLPIEVLDASAQVVLEADLFAPTPEQPPPQLRISSAELLSGSGRMVDVPEVMGLPDFKQFRKQGGQQPYCAVQPLPVFLVDNFQRTEETEAFLRLQEERAINKRRAEEMFKSADVGSKRPSRGP
ncbi:hypothetical protein VaNZ11_014488, partial [Volvox africanus]